MLDVWFIYVFDYVFGEKIMKVFYYLLVNYKCFGMVFNFFGSVKVRLLR